MSKMAAVDTAVRQQIASDDKNIGYGDKMNVATTGYAGDEDVERFLLGVANRLKLDTPSYLFDWSALEASKIHQRNLLIVLSLIDEKTKPVESGKLAIATESK